MCYGHVGSMRIPVDGRYAHHSASIRFSKNGAVVHGEDTVLYVDALAAAGLTLEGLPEGSVDSVSFYIGIPADRNVHGAIPPTAANVAMEWPDAMGGGYHFLKLEGHWTQGGAPLGYAAHLGTNRWLIPTGVRATLQLPGGGERKAALTMEINGWFESPHTYSFANDGVYTMGDSVLMRRIAENGKDIFKLTSIN